MHKFQSSKLLFILFNILIISTFTVSAQENWNWKIYSPNNQSWSILSPGTLTPDAEAGQSNSSRGSYTYNDFNGFLAVIYRDAPRNIFPFRTDYKGYLKDVRDDVAKANNGEIIKDVEFSRNGYTGREIYVKFPSGTIQTIEGKSVVKYRIQRFRVFFVGRRFFALLVVLPENEIDTPAINKFLDSFSFNTPPTAQPDFYSIDEDNTLNIGSAKGVLSNDKDAERNPITVAPVRPLSAPSHGSLTLNLDGSFIYIPSANFNGIDTFTYNANDGLMDSKSPATVSITVKPVNDPPVLTNVPAKSTVDELTPLAFRASGSDIDNPPNSLRFTLTGAPDGAIINQQTGDFSWIPDEDQGPGNFTFKVDVSDGAAVTSQAITVVVKEINVAPQLSNVPSAATIDELQPYTFIPNAIDVDIPKQNLSFSLINAPNGASINAQTGGFSWTPTEEQGNNSTYSFTLRVSDGVVTTDVPVNLTVKEVNSNPIFSNITDQSVDELKGFNLKVAATDTDNPANILTYSLDTGYPIGMTINAQNGLIIWTPSEEQGPNDYSVSVRVTDNGTPALSDVKTFKISVNEVNVAPKLKIIENKVVNEETSLNFKVSANDSDLPVNILSYSLINAPNGAVINPQSGEFSWTPTEEQGQGNYQIKVRVMDNGSPNLSDENVFGIVVNEVNKAPVVENLPISLNEDTSVSFSLKGTDTDLPANYLNFIIVKPPIHGKLTGTIPNLMYVPNPDFNGSDNFTYKVNDGSLDSNQAIVSINIIPINDLPIAKDDAATTTINRFTIINVLANDSDVDGNKLIITDVLNVLNGTAEIINGQVKFTPKVDFTGNGNFSYIISDGKGGTARATVLIKIE